MIIPCWLLAGLTAGLGVGLGWMIRDLTILVWDGWRIRNLRKTSDQLSQTPTQKGRAGNAGPAKPRRRAG
jgi:hypothetical protein